MSTDFTGSTDQDRRRTRREHAWAWASLLTLVIAWDASSRLDEHVSAPRVRIAHAGIPADSLGTRIDLRPPGLAAAHLAE